MVTTRRGLDTASPATATAVQPAAKRVADDSPTTTPAKRRKLPHGAQAETNGTVPDAGIGDVQKLESPDMQQAEEDEDEEDEDEDDVSSPAVKAIGPSSPPTRSAPAPAPNPLTPPRPAGSRREVEHEQEIIQVRLPALEEEEEEETEHVLPPDLASTAAPLVASLPERTRPTDDINLAVHFPVNEAEPPAMDNPRPVPDQTSYSDGKEHAADPNVNERDPATMETPQPQATQRDSPSTIYQTAQKHLRFGSEELEPPSSSIYATPFELPARKEHEIAPDLQESENDSDDEAPETVSKTSALEKLRAVEQDAVHAVEQQEQAAKAKRRARDALLKSQAKQSSTPSQKQQQQQRPTQKRPRSPSPIPPSPSTSPSQSKIPSLLPDSLLASLPDVRPPTPPLRSPSPIPRRKHTKFTQEGPPQPPKDIKRGPVSVRVLSSANPLLAPPRGDARTANIRERWLKGRPTLVRKKGKGGKAFVAGGRMERREERREFLRS